MKSVAVVARLPARVDRRPPARTRAWRRFVPVLALALGLVILASACASSSAGVSRTNRSVITQAELEGLGVRDMYEAIERLRPLWLTTRGQRSLNMSTEIAVVQNGSYLGRVETLRSISPNTVREARFMDGSAAAHALPSLSRGRHVDGAIFVEIGGT